ncbi:MAG: DUF4339 domain-containing protein [Bythopirellula sp.]|nr:DUF4339 domain-containing protein [Bythopirellula sp.]
MGIRFYCPNGHKLNVKSFLAGKRGICPDCDTKFIVPAVSGGTVEAIDENEPPPPPSPLAEINMPGDSGVGLATDVWHVRTATGQQHGPATTAVLKTWIVEKKIDRDSWVWRTGWLDWQRASDVFPELGAVLETPAVPRPKSFVEESLDIQIVGPLPNEAEAVSLHRRRQKQKREQVKAITLFLGGMIVLLTVVMLVVLLR